MGEGKMAEMRAPAEADAGAVDLLVIPGLGDDIAACRDIQAQWDAELAASRRLGGGEPEVYPPTGYTGLTADQAAALRGGESGESGESGEGIGVFTGPSREVEKCLAFIERYSSRPLAVPVNPGPAADIAEGHEEQFRRTVREGWTAYLAGAHLQRNGGEGFVESEDGHVFKLSDAANAHMKRVGAVYTACRWAAGQEQPFSVHTGGQPRDWTPGARFRFKPAPLGEAGEEVGVTLICVVPGSDIHRAQVIFRVDGAPAPRSLLIGLWKLATRPEGA